MADIDAIRAEKLAALQRQAAMPQGVVAATDSGLADLLQRYPLVFVDFWAPWCGPCKMFAPVFEAASRDHAGQAVFVKINVDEEQLAAMRYQIQSIPTLMVFQDGVPVARQSGAMPGSTFDGFVRRFMS